MRFESTFQVHVADPIGFEESPFIVTTAYTNPGGYPKGEWFLVVPDGEGNSFAQRLRLEDNAFPEGPVQFDESFLLKEMLSQAKLRLRRYIMETKGKEALPLLAKRMDALPSDPSLFVNFWLRGVFADSLAGIRNMTECDPLRDFLSWVFELPTLRSIDLQ